MAAKNVKVKTTYKSIDDAGEHGFIYQRFLAYGIYLRLIRLNRGFSFYTEWKDAGKFDDIAFEIKRGNTIEQGFYIQVKHTAEPTIIDHIQLFPNDEKQKRDGDFSIYKYVKSYFILRRTNQNKKKMIIFTNRGFQENTELLKLVSIATDKTETIMDEVLLGSDTSGKSVTFEPTEYGYSQLSDYINNDFLSLKDAIGNLFKYGIVSDILSTHKYLLRKILKQTTKYITFKDGFNEHNPNQGIVKLFRTIESALEVKSASVLPKIELFKTWPHADDLIPIKNAIVKLIQTGNVPDILRDYKTVLMKIIEKSGQELCFAKSFIENSKLCTMLEKELNSLEDVVITPDKMFLEEKRINHKSLPTEEKDFQTLLDALLELCREGTVNDVLKQYKLPLCKVLEKTEGNKYKFKESFIVSDILCNKLTQELGDVSKMTITIKETFLDNRNSKFNIHKEDIQLLVNDIVELFRTGTITEILKHHKFALNNIFAEREGIEQFRFAKSFYEHYELSKVSENLTQVEVTPKEMFLDKCLPAEGEDEQLPSDSKEFEGLKEALRDLFETGTVADVLKEYKVPLRKILEKTADGKKLRFKTNKNAVLCKLLENDLGDLNTVKIELPSMLFDTKNSKFKNFPIADNNILPLKTAIQNLWKNGVVDKVLLKYQTPLQEILVKNDDGTMKFAPSFDDRNKNYCIRILYELLKADSVDMSSVIKPERLIFKTFALPCFDSEVGQLKHSLTKLFTTYDVDDVLIDYQVALKDILQPCYKIEFSESFTETSEEFNIGLLCKKLKEDNINCSDKQLSIYVKKQILDDDNSGVRHMPFFVDKTDIQSFFEKFVLLHSQPHGLYPLVVSELHLHMKTWMRTDIFGNLRDKDSKLAFDVFEESFNKALKDGTIKNEKNVLHERSLDDLKGQLQIEFESKYPELRKQLYINRQIRCGIPSSPEHDLEKRSDQILETHKNRNGETALPVSMKYVNISDQQLAIDLKDKFEGYPCFILTADPGMGKTMLLHYIALEMQILGMGTVHLVHLDKIQKSLKGIAKHQVLNILQPILSPGNFQRILDVTTSKRDEPITILFDAFDEIHAGNKGIVIELFKVLLRAKSLRLIISGRKHVEQPLLDAFKAKAFDLKPVMLLMCPLADGSQKQIMKSVWSGLDYQEEQFNNYSNRLLGKIEVVIPLVVKLLAELFEERFKCFCRKNVEDQKIELGKLERNRFEQVKIYEMFLSTIFRTNGAVAQFDETFCLYDDAVRGKLHEHLMLAIKTLDVKELSNIFGNYGNRLMYNMFCQKCLQTSGKSILIEIVDGEIKFTHQSFGEFLIARHLYDNLSDHKATLSNMLQRNENIKKNVLMMIENRYVEANDEDEQMWFQQHLEEAFEECNELALFACESRCAELVNFFLSKKNEEQLKSLKGYDNMLHVATTNESIEICSLLINVYKFDVNKSYKATSAICIAAEKGHTEIVKLLLSKGAKTNALNEKWWTPLLIAASGGHSEIVISLIDAGANIELPEHIFGETAVHVAALYGKVDVLRILIEKKAEIDVRNSFGNTPLYFAASNGHTDVVDLLIEKGADTELTVQSNGTAMHAAAFYGEVEVLNALIAKKANIHAKDEYGWTPLHTAAERGHLDAVNLLIEKGADTERSTESDGTAMHVAASKGRVDVLNTLIAKDAKINAQNNKGWTPLHSAAENGHIDALILLIDKGADTELSKKSSGTAMHVAASNGNVDVLSTLIDKKAKIDAQDYYGWTPLHDAVQIGHIDSVNLLIGKGANMELSMKCGRTAMHVAALYGRVEVLSALIAKKAEIDARDNYGCTPLHCAAQNGHIEEVVLLIDKGANIELFNKSGKTAMHFAASNGRLDVLRTLIEKNAKVDAQDKYGLTPFHSAAQNGHIDAVVLLINEGAKFELPEKCNKTAVHFAASTGRVDVLNILISKEAKINVQDKYGWTPLHYAAQNDHIDVVVMLIDNGADINLSKNCGKTAMHLAASNGRVNVLRTLIAREARIDAQDKKGWTPLHYAAQNGHNEAVVLLTEKRKNIELSGEVAT
ncbi:uncharacterized protein LOC134205710 [Armigeres subalbatus]|uniref:uncharacterized protein LOC134205710 n=1 Tax=Armigeres subalbatus TaxID=124917 RepID=UPI002ED2D739